ncbi:hypothetical protein SmJEL517_g02341 [Synchytrium microbalum]|uniref:Cyclin n=1 Tax=Synchytrium microbalum TaxID=1806994 RepID=A0A507CCC3_9FUNG|nr:uncharacterized protein SmJEL517_g02341 [Synchytrium microbalum]TPX35215.1 hypothetical protein SmJEL517_g02341 [Synchytrium microbalum]
MSAAQPVHQVPEFFHLADTADILQLVVDMFNRLITHNDAIPVTPNNLTRFHSRANPAISIGDYLRRIVKYASVEKSVLLLLLIYIDRLCERHKTFTISSLTAHRYIITAVTVGSKALSDIYPTNTHFAKVGGISVMELNLLELEMCTMIGWRLAVTVETLQQYYINLVRTSNLFALAPNTGGGNSPTTSNNDGGGGSSSGIPIRNLIPEFIIPSPPPDRK